MKRPSFQFYPGDWLREPSLRACSVAARGLWIDMICIMHDGCPYGHLTLGGKGILPPVLARLVGASIGEVEGWLNELEEVGVFSRTDAGVIYSRRMIEDERIRQARAAGGVKSLEHPNVPKKKDGPSRKKGSPRRISFNPSPSSSSSSSSSDGTEDESSVRGKPRDPYFEVFTERYSKEYGVAYLHKKADFVQLANCKRQVGPTLTDWGTAVDHYFASEIGTHTLADISSRFGTFFRCALDRYGKPLTNGNGSSAASMSTPKTAGNIAAIEAFLADGTTGGHR